MRLQFSYHPRAAFFLYTFTHHLPDFGQAPSIRISNHSIRIDSTEPLHLHVKYTASSISIKASIIFGKIRKQSGSNPFQHREEPVVVSQVLQKILDTEFSLAENI